MPNIWVLGGDSEEVKWGTKLEEETAANDDDGSTVEAGDSKVKWGTELEEKTTANDDGSTADEASTLYEAIGRLAPHVPVKLMDLVRDHIKSKFPAEAAATDEPRGRHGWYLETS